MTTAAPPEKMTNAELTDEYLAELESRVSRGVIISYKVALQLLAEIKRLREAARRLAPRVGDEGVTPELRRAWLERLLAEAVQWVELDSDQPLGGKKLTWLKLARSATKHLRPALSAPPAASAERDDLLQFIYGWVQPEMTVPITDALIKAGYRKRAAQGVVVSNVDLMAAVFALLEEGRADVAAPLQEAIRLSALPKGQEHEG